VDETRPLLQGGRLTTWELEKAGVPYTLICDNMSGSLMAQGKVSKVFLGADRIATNGDFANKIGTYNLAVLCNYHKVPFYTVAPLTTVDFECPSGKQIPVEMRKESEGRGVFGHFGDIRWAPENAPVYNPAFDVTPSSLLTGMVIDDKVITKENLKDLSRLRK
jgi:methylthioribose-1-phosphate isomerase